MTPSLILLLSHVFSFLTTEDIAKIKVSNGWTSHRNIAIKNNNRRISLQINVYLWEHKLLRKDPGDNSTGLVLS